MTTRFITATIALLCSSIVLSAEPDPTLAATYKALKQISAPGDGAMFGVTKDDEIYRWTGLDWVRVEGALTQISAGSKTEVWGVSATFDIWQAIPTGWLKRPGRLRQVAVSKGGNTVVGLDMNYKPVIWDGVGTWRSFPNSPTMTEVAIGKTADQIYGVGQDDQVYRWRPGGKWTQIKGRLRKISVGRDGTLGGVNSDKEGFLRTDSDVQAELNGTTVTPDWRLMPTTVESVEIVDGQIAILSDSQGLMIQLGLPWTDGKNVDGMIQLDSTLTPSEVKPPFTDSFYGPEIVITGGTSKAIILGECVVLLSPTMKLDIEGAPEIEPVNPKTKCVIGKFKNIQAVPPVQNHMSPIHVRPITYGDEQPAATANDFVGKSKEYVAGRYGEGLTPLACPQRTFLNMSHRTWVSFQMPPGHMAEFITIPAGAHARYVAPACHRVKWDNLFFACMVDFTTLQWEWKLLAGPYDADGLCHGDPGPKFFFDYGDR